MGLTTTARTGAQRIARCCHYSTTSTLQQAQGNHNELPAPPPWAGYARLTNRGLISITGVDSTTFLQGLVTQNMLVTNDPQRSTRRTGCYTAFLNSQGRMLHDAFLYPLLPASGHGLDTNTDTDAHEPGWLVEVDKSEIPRLMKHFKKHKLRAKLKLRALDEGERTVWSTWKDHSEPRWAAYNLEPPESMTSSPFGRSSSVVGCIDTRAPGFGSRLVVPGAEDLGTYLSVVAEKEAGRKGDGDSDTAQHAVTGSEVGLETYTVRRMLHGIAEGQAEIIYESALPLECNIDMMRGVDFRKGCYLGQELTIRTHHTGVVRKRILPVQLYTSDDDGQQSALTGADMPVYDPTASLALPPRGANISKISARKGRSAGKFLAGVGNIGLALCRLEMMTDVALTGEGSAFTPNQEFRVTWDGTEDSSQETGGSGEVKIRAIVPPWTKEFISSGGARKHASNTDSAEGHRARDLVEQLEEEVAQRRNE